MSRDTYHDYVTFQDLEDAGRDGSCWMLRRCHDALRFRSGANNVSNAEVRSFYDPSVDVMRLGVSFDSRAWTGRP